MMTQLREIIADKSNELGNASTSKETDELNIFLGFCAGIICDGRVLESEVRALRNRFMRSERLREEVAFYPLCKAVEEALADDMITEEESEDIEEWLGQLVGDGYADTGFTNIGNVAKLDDPILDPETIELKDSVFVLTGPMRMGPRAYIEKEIKRAGGTMASRATRKVDYVVISSTASRHWRTTHFGTKIERARELIEEGCKLRFVSEVALEKALSGKG
ncbi:BRCT domain-containing protein [Fodinicurvata halophila]